MAAIAISLPQDSDKTVITAYDEGRLAERLLVAATMLGLGAGIAWIREQFRAILRQAPEAEAAPPREQDREHER